MHLKQSSFRLTFYIDKARFRDAPEVLVLVLALQLPETVAVDPFGTVYAEEELVSAAGLKEQSMITYLYFLRTATVDYRPAQS